MKFNFVGQSYQDRSLPFSAQRCINYYPVLDESKQARSVAKLEGTPGLTLFDTGIENRVYETFVSGNGRAFSIENISASVYGVYEVFSDGSKTNRGNITSSTAIFTLDENFTQLGICDGANLYILTYATNVLAQVVDVDFPGGGTVTCIDNYFIVNKPNTDEWYYSALGDGTSWTSTGFYRAESSSDPLVRVFAAYGQLWLFGLYTTEAWYNTGDATDPFSRVDGAKMQVGCAAALSVKDVDNGIVWLGQDKKGRGMVYKTNGYSPQRISTYAIERMLQGVSDLTAIKSYSYQQEGHLFYGLTGEALETSLVFDVSTNMWHERGLYAVDGNPGWIPFPIDTCMSAFGKILGGGAYTIGLFEMSLDAYKVDDGSVGYPIRRERITTHLENDDELFTVDELVVGFEAGVGLTTGQGSDPQAMLRVSEDGGQTWSTEYQASIGQIGEYKKRCVWRRLGRSNCMTFSVAVSDPVKASINYATIKVS